MNPEPPGALYVLMSKFRLWLVKMVRDSHQRKNPSRLLTLYRHVGQQATRDGSHHACPSCCRLKQGVENEENVHANALSKVEVHRLQERIRLNRNLRRGY